MLKRIKLRDFAIFRNNDIQFAGPGVNLIIGKNSTGKSLLLKLIYSIGHALNSYGTKSKEEFRYKLSEKIHNVFMVDKVGRLTSRVQGNKRTKVSVEFDFGQVGFEFSTRHEKVEITKLDVQANNVKEIIFIPTKEIISMMSRGFTSLYRDYKFLSEEYYDLAQKLEMPLPQGRQDKKVEKLKELLNKFGLAHLYKTYVKNKEYYTYIEGLGNIESKLLAEGYRKLLMLIYLIKNGEMEKSAYLLWDEPEVNLNPSLSKAVIELLFFLAEEFSLQIFVATHDYFIMKYCDLIAEERKLPVRFLSLYFDENHDLKVSEAEFMYGLHHNDILDEFEKIYKMEVSLTKQSL